MAWHEPLRGGGYRGRYYDQDGNKQSVLNAEGKGFKTPRMAKRAAEDAAAAARRTATAASANKGNEHLSPSMTWGEWWDMIVGLRSFDSSDTAQVERAIVNKHIRPRWGDKPLNEIKFNDVKQWVAVDLKPRKGLSPAYVQRIFNVFSPTFRMAMETDPPILDATPCSKVPLPKRPKRAKKHLPVSAAAKLESHLRPDMQAAIEFCMETGMRPGELAGLHAHRLDLERGWVDIVDMYVNRKKLIRPLPKDGDERTVPLTPRAIELAEGALWGRDRFAGCGLEHWEGERCESALVFLTVRGKPVTPPTLTYHLKMASQGAQVGSFTGYAIRRGLATRAADGGVDAYQLSDVLGHETLEESKGYVQRSEASRQRFISALGDPVGYVGRARGANLDLSGSSVVDREGCGQVVSPAETVVTDLPGSSGVVNGKTAGQTLSAT
jgi:integrase